MVSARTPKNSDVTLLSNPQGPERATLAAEGMLDLIRLALEDTERVPEFDGEAHAIIVDDRDPEWSADNLIRGAALLREGKKIIVHQVTHSG
jgi:hypothetical protein